MSDHSEPAGCSGVLKGSQNMGSIRRSPAGNADVQVEEHTRRGRSLQAQFLKSKETAIGDERTPGRLPATSDAVHSAKDMVSGKGTLDIIGGRPRGENTRAFGAERMILSETSICRMESSCVDRKNVDLSPFSHSGIVSSKWRQYRDINTNQRTKSVVRSKRKSGHCDASLDSGQLQTTMSGFASNPGMAKPMPEEFQFQGEYMVQHSRLYRFSEKKRLPSSGFLQNVMDLTSGYPLKGVSRMPDRGSSIFSREENIHSVSGMTDKEMLANHSCLDLDKTCEPYQSLFTISERRRDENLILGCLFPVPRDQSPKAYDHPPTDFHGSEPLLIDSSIQGVMKQNKSDHEQHSQERAPGSSTRAGALRKCTNVDSVGRLVGLTPESSKAFQYLVVAKETGMILHERDKIGRTPKSEENTHVTKFRRVGFSINGEKKGDPSINGFSIDLQNESPMRTALTNRVAHGENNLPADVTAPRSDKKMDASQDFVRMQNIRKPELGLTHKMKGAMISNQETESTTKGLSPCIGTAGSMDPKGLGITRTESMDVEHIISQPERPEKSDSIYQLENHLGPEASSRWVKRLKVNLDSLSIGTRDNSMEDVLTTRKVHRLFSKVMNYSRSNSFTLAKCLQERQQFQKTMLLLRNNDSPVESLMESHPWIRRLCRKSRGTVCPMSRQPIEVLCEPEKTGPLPERLEGRLFPGLAAMALMGKSINNFRPCEIRRRGSSLVWNTEGF